MSDEEVPYSYEQLQKMASIIRTKSGDCKPTIGIVAGSGQGALVDSVQNAVKIPYTDIEGFPQSTVAGHSGEFVIGKIDGKEVLVMSGRLHLYEGYPSWKVTAPIRIMHLLGIKTLVVTNAAGSLTNALSVGSIVILKDHIYLPGLCGLNPLMGSNEGRFGPRFLDVSKPYSKKLRDIAKEVVAETDLSNNVKEGIYCMVSGPMYETPAEVRFLRCIGADVVGMSTCPETIVARHCGMEVLGLTLVTDVCSSSVDDEVPPLTHEEVLKVSKKRAGDLKSLIEKVVMRLS